MILLADENIDLSVVARLRAAGYRVFAVAEINPGVTDDAVLGLANEHGAILLTEDKDFGELVFRQGLVHAEGIKRGQASFRLAFCLPKGMGRV